MNPLKFGIGLLLLVSATACGGNKQPKDAATTDSQPFSQATPAQNPGDENASDSLSITPADSAKVKL